MSARQMELTYGEARLIDLGLCEMGAQKSDPAVPESVRELHKRIVHAFEELWDLAQNSGRTRVLEIQPGDLNLMEDSLTTIEHRGDSDGRAAKELRQAIKSLS